MIVPMKKVSLIMLDGEREKALKALRRLGVLHIDVQEGSSEKLMQLKKQIADIEACLYAMDSGAGKDLPQVEIDAAKALRIARRTSVLAEEKNVCRAYINTWQSELERLKEWGEIDLTALSELAEGGIAVSLYDMPPAVYDALGEDVTTCVLSRSRSSVRLVRLDFDGASCSAPSMEGYQIELPARSTAEIHERIDSLTSRIAEIDAILASYAGYTDAMKAAIAGMQKEMELENHASGMLAEALGESDVPVTIAYLRGYLPAEKLSVLESAAEKHAWGLLAEDPTPEDDVPTELRNNKFVSLVYPLTDFIGTVPGYFEYDISGWFLGFILVFFGIIFGDGGYGLLICGAAGALILKSRLAKKPIPPAFLLVALLGAATILWGMLTCTWFGLEPAVLPGWLQKLSIPVISNVYEDRIWYPFWTNGEAGLTTAQNVQIVCFTLALIQLSVAHIKGMVRNRHSLKMLGDLGSILQLIGIFYVVLSLVVNSAVFGLGLVIAGIPVGTVAIACVGVGFVVSFIFANYEGSIGASILESLKNIVSVLLGVVNVFSDIVSYIRLWAVGLAGAAISATVNELAGPLFGNFLFIVFAIIILVFGHGLNMILNVLSVIVHGVRLNTLEFSSHLDMSWSGHTYKPFKE